MNNYYITERFEQNGIPVLLDRSETHNVFDNKVILDTLPDEYNKVRITHINGVSTNEMVEIPYYKPIESSNHYKIDYKVTGFLYTHPSKEAQTLQVSYKGKGYVCVHPNRIAAIISENGTILQTLDVVIDETIEAKDDAITATNNANTAINTINNTNAAMHVFENYNHTKAYVPLNKVLYNGNSYVNIAPCTGVYPVNTSNWLMISRHGNDGIASFDEVVVPITANGTTHIVHNLTIDPIHDVLKVIETEFGTELEKGVSYNENIDGESIDLIGWSANNGDKFKFKLYKGMNDDTLQEVVDDSIVKKGELQAVVNDSVQKKTDLQNVINTADTVTYATKGDTGLKSNLATIDKTNIVNAINENKGRLDSHDVQLAEMTQKNVLTVTVGTGGDYLTINEALKYLSTKKVQYNINGYKSEIKLLSGFVMQEQILVDGLDLGYIEISSVDAEVTISRQHLTNIIGADDGITAKPAFGARQNAVLPEINVLFYMDESGESDVVGDPTKKATLKHGFFIADNSSVYIRPGKGCKNASDNGIYVINGSKALAFGGIFDNAKGSGVRCFRGSYLNVRMGSIKNAGESGVYLGSSSKVVALGADFSFAKDHGIWCYNLGQIDVRDGKATDCGDYAIYAQHATLVSAGNIDLSRANLGCIFAEDGASVEAHDAIISNCILGSGIQANSGARVTAVGATITGNKLDGVLATAAEVNVSECTITGNLRGGVWANRGSRITANTTTALGGTSEAFKVTYGSIISAPSSTGTLSIAANTITSAGIIFQ